MWGCLIKWGRKVGENECLFTSLVTFDWKPFYYFACYCSYMADTSSCNVYPINLTINMTLNGDCRMVLKGWVVGGVVLWLVNWSVSG